MKVRTYTDNFVRQVAYRVQERAFGAGALLGLAFIGFALTDRERLAAVFVGLMLVALGVSIGAWIVAQRFK